MIEVQLFYFNNENDTTRSHVSHLWMSGQHDEMNSNFYFDNFTSSTNVKSIRDEINWNVHFDRLRRYINVPFIE